MILEQVNEDKWGGNLTCLIVTEGALGIQCGELLRKRNFAIAGVVSETRAVVDWANSSGIRCIDPRADIVASLGGNFVDFLFSIVNLRLLPPEVCDLANQAVINFHDGPLPRYAGMHATSWAILNGESLHGVSWHGIEKEVDAGALYKQQLIEIDSGETARSLNTKCFEAGIQSFDDLLSDLVDGTSQSCAQDRSQRSYFGMYQRPPGAGIISWSKPAEEIEALVRALDFGPYENRLGKAKLLMGDEFFICLQAVANHNKVETTLEPGCVTHVDQAGISVATGRGEISIQQLARLDGRPLSIQEISEQLGIKLGMHLPELAGEELRRIAELNEECARHEEFWTKQLNRLHPPSLAYLSNEPSDGRKPRWVSIKRQMPIGELSIPGARRSQILLGAVIAYIGRLSSERQFTVGMCRGPTEQGAARQLFASTVPWCVEFDPSDSVRAAFEKGVQLQAELQKHQTFILDMPSRYPALGAGNVVTSLDALPVELEFEGSATSPRQPHAALRIVVGNDGRQCEWIFDPNRLSEENAQRMLDQFSLFVEGCAQNPDQPVGMISLMPATEVKRVLETWNDTSRRFPKKTIHEVIEQQSQDCDVSIAVVCGDQQLTYRELSARSNQLARHLRKLGAGPDKMVGLCMERSCDLVVGMLGILKAGAAYVPMDPAYPRDRIAYMLENADVSLLVTEINLSAVTTNHEAAIVNIDADWEVIAQESENALDAGAASDHLAYVIYTSGSTGKPKGVMVEHRNVINFFLAMDDCVTYEPGDVWLAVTSLSFDISVLELLWTLARGLKVVIFAQDDLKATLPTASKYADKPIDFSLFYFSADQGENPADKYRLLLEGARFADAHEFTAVWTPERHFHEFGGLYPNPAVTSAALAMITERVQLRSGSLVAPLHSPLRIAEEWSVVDNLSKGRAGISFASGWAPNDFVLKPENFENRKEVMFQYIDQVRQLWRGEALHFPNPLGDEVEYRILPKPIQEQLPVWVTTAGNPDTYQQAARAGANILTHLLGQSVEEVAEKIALYRKTWSESGYAGRGHISLMLHTFVCDSLDLVHETVREPLKNYLRTSANLIRSYSWAFPTFKRQGKSIDDVNFENLSSEEMDALLDHAFNRYFETSGLFGTPESAMRMIDKLKAYDIDEVACLVDFGVNTDVVLSSLPHLNELRRKANLNVGLLSRRDSISSLIKRHNVTHLQCTPAMASMLLLDETTRGSLANLKQMLVGGEALSRDLAQRLQAVVTNVVNMYGPTETTVWSASFRLDANQGESATVPIGRPVANTQIYLVDDNFQPVPVGMPGELLIGGAGVVRGYHGLPKLTDERFVPNAFAPEKSEKLYRTGDLARYRTDGVLEFLGRRDHQVKIRGYRIELGEIESHLNEHAQVRESVVVAREDLSGDKRLVAYLIPAYGTLSQSQLRTYLQGRLPDYMVPGRFVQLDRFPQTPNKKTDRARLPAPERERPKLDVAFQAPETLQEKKLAKIWQEILGIEQVGRNDQFLELGGDSLQAVNLFVQIEKEFGEKLPLATVLQARTLAQLASRLTADDTAQPKEETWSCLVPLRTQGTKPPLFFVHGAAGNVLFYHDLVIRLQPDYPFYAFQSHRLNGSDNEFVSIEDLATRYIPEILAVQPEGPYYIGGYCVGGTIAYEIAQQLQSAGHDVALLTLLDTYNYSVTRMPQTRRQKLFRTLQQVEFNLANLIGLGIKDGWSYLWRKLRKENRRAIGKVAVGLKNISVNRRTKKRSLEVLHDEAGCAYQPKPYHGRMVVFKPQRNFDTYVSSQMGWEEIQIDDLQVVQLPVNPGGMLVEPYVKILAERLLPVLTQEKSSSRREYAQAW